MSKYFFLLIVGITTGIWINFNSKTFLTWKKFFCCHPDLNNNNNNNNNNNDRHHSQYHHRYGNHNGRNAFGINYSYKHTKINGSKYSLPSSKQMPLAHV
jgi:hypothetical protein